MRDEFRVAKIYHCEIVMRDEFRVAKMAVSWFPRSKLEPGKTSRKMKLPVQK
jgi:hypothetical protein